MRSYFLLLLLLVSCCLNKVSGQSLFLSDGIIENGKYLTLTNKSLNFENQVGINKVVFFSGSISMINPVLVISKKKESIYQITNRMKLEKLSQISYTSDLIWHEDGDYKLTVIDGLKEVISEYFTVDVNENGSYDTDLSGNNSNEYNDPNNTFYYINSKVDFCKSMSATNEPIDLSNEFTTGNVVVFLTNDKPVITTEFKVSVIRIKGKHKQELLEKKYYPVNSGEKTVSFNYYFGNKGYYLISVFTSNDVWINDGYIKIKN